MGSTRVVHICLATIATLLHSSVEAFLNEVHIRLQPCESTPEGPALPSVLRAAFLMISPSRWSNKTGCMSSVGVGG